MSSRWLGWHRRSSRIASIAFQEVISHRPAEDAVDTFGELPCFVHDSIHSKREVCCAEHVEVQNPARFIAVLDCRRIHGLSGRQETPTREKKGVVCREKRLSKAVPNMSGVVSNRCMESSDNKT